MLNNDNVISSEALNYEPYHQSRGDGFSGQLLLAVDISNPEKKYIIKAANAHVAACEFMFYRLALKLGLSVARVRLVAPARRDEFEYPACAVDFIPNAVKLNYNDFIKIEECEMLINLSFILGDSDNMDFLRDESGVVYKIDHSDCFGIEGMAETWINPQKDMDAYRFYQMVKPAPCINRYFEKGGLKALHEKIADLSISDFDDDLALVNKFCGVSFENHFQYYISKLIEQCNEII